MKKNVYLLIAVAFLGLQSCSKEEHIDEELSLYEEKLLQKEELEVKPEVVMGLSSHEENGGVEWLQMTSTKISCNFSSFRYLIYFLQ